MAILSIQAITQETRIDGRVVGDVLEVSCSSGFSQINAECTVWCAARPSWADEGSAMTVWASNGSNSGQIFGGEVSGFDWTYFPSKVGVVCQDLLARVREAWGGDEYEYTDQAAAAIIRNLLEKKAIPSSLANIEDSDILPNLGIIEVITLKEGDTPYSIISSIDDLDGYKTYTSPQGTILRRRVGGQIGSSGALVFEKGVVILGGPRHNRTRLGIVNRTIVTGLTYEGLIVGGPGVAEASAPNPYVTDPSGYITETIQSNLVEDDTTALAVAQRRVLDKNRRPETIEFSFPFDPRPQPAMTVQVNHADLEMGSALVLVQSVSHQISSGGATTTIRAIGGALAGPSLQPPVAQFSVQLILEGEDTGSGVSALIVVIADGSTSYDPDGTIASYAWTASATGATPAPTSGSGAVFRTTVDAAATDVTLTLTVTDNDGQTGLLSLTTPIDTTTMPVEDLYLAYGDVAVSSDGEQTWRVATPASGAATCLSPIAPAYEAWGTSTGHIYATFDKLATDLVDLGAPHGAVACTAVWIHETDSTRLWAGFSDGKVYFGLVDTAAFTASWTLKGTIPDSPIREIRESYGTFGELRANAGAGYYYSANGGASWSIQHTFDTAWRMAAGFDINLASGLNDAAPLYDEDGTPPTVPGGVEHIRGLSFGYRVQELYAADDAANLYLGPGPSFDLSLSADTTPAQVNHMIRSGNIDRVVYMAVGDGTGDNGFVKWIPECKAPFFIRRTLSDAGLMIGYGSLHTPDVTASFLVPTWGTSSGGVYAGGAGGWALKNSGLPSGATYWRWVAANPFNPLEWLVLGSTDAGGVCDISSGNVVMPGGSSSVLWYTSDAGASWSPVTLTSATPAAVGGIFVSTVAWDDVRSGRWLLILSNSVDHTTEWWWGTHSSSGSVLTNASGIVSGTPSIVGLGGDLVIAPTAEDEHLRYVADSSTAYTTPPGGTSYRILSYAMDRAPFSSRGVALRTRSTNIDPDRLFVTLDYRASQPTPNDVVGTIGGDLTWAADGVYLSSGALGSGIDRVTNPASGTATRVVDDGVPYVAIRADRRTRRVVAALGSATNTPISVYNGTTWSKIAGPLSNPAGAAACIEVIT